MTKTQHKKPNPALVAALVILLAALFTIAYHAMLLDLRYEHEEDLARITTGQAGPLTGEQAAGLSLLRMCTGGMVLCICLGVSLLLPRDQRRHAGKKRKRSATA